ncbi:hypothetical protein B0H34DRAFT_841226 [Crassisporium funariophilum]|nr:hypothetical protein B0H34DRAFT_841226 [Crassisporium funariophilum]
MNGKLEQSTGNCESTFTWICARARISGFSTYLRQALAPPKCLEDPVSGTRLRRMSRSAIAMPFRMFELVEFKEWRNWSIREQGSRYAPGFWYAGSAEERRFVDTGENGDWGMEDGRTNTIFDVGGRNLCVPLIPWLQGSAMTALAIQRYTTITASSETTQFRADLRNDRETRQSRGAPLRAGRKEKPSEREVTKNRGWRTKYMSPVELNPLRPIDIAISGMKGKHGSSEQSPGERYSGREGKWKPFRREVMKNREWRTKLCSAPGLYDVILNLYPLNRVNCREWE